MDCFNCGREFKVDDVFQEAYVSCETPDGLRRFTGSDTYIELIYVHFKCPTIGQLVRRAMEKDYERRILKDNSPDAVCMPLGGGSKMAMDYVHRHGEYEHKHG